MNRLIPSRIRPIHLPVVLSVQILPLVFSRFRFCSSNPYLDPLIPLVLFLPSPLATLLPKIYHLALFLNFPEPYSVEKKVMQMASWDGSTKVVCDL